MTRSTAAVGRSRDIFAQAAGWLLMLAGTFVVVGCDTSGSSAAADRGTGQIGVPDFLANARAVNIDQLSVVVTVGGDEVPIARSGSTYTGSFRLPNDATYPFEVLWSYSVTGRTAPIPVARASTTVSLTNPSRTIQVEGYDTADFNEDGDEFDNFTEIDQGTDPLVADMLAPVTPSANQSDCRDTVLPGAPADEADLPRDLFRLGNRPFEQTRSLDFDRDRRIYFATFFLESPGDLLVEQRSGQPVNTTAILYDRRVGATVFDGSANVSVLANPGDTSDGIPASVEALLPPGLYCYALLDETADTIATGPILTDIVLRIEFTPSTAPGATP